MPKKASSQDLTESIAEAEKAIKEHNELKVFIIDLCHMYHTYICM